MKSYNSYLLSSVMLLCFTILACSEKKGEQPSGGQTSPQGTPMKESVEILSEKAAVCDPSANKLGEFNKFYSDLNKVDSLQLFRNTGTNTNIKLTNALLSLDGNLAFVQAASDPSFRLGNMGLPKKGMSAIYVYARRGSNWVQQAKLEASDKRNAFDFGKSLSLSADGSILIVGAPSSPLYDYSEDSYQGAVYIFRQKEGVWALQSRLSAPGESTEGKKMGRFAESVAISADGKTALVSADLVSKPIVNREKLELAKDSRSLDGAVYIYSLEGNDWHLQSTLTSQTDLPDARFGNSIAISPDGSRIMVGSVETKNINENTQTEQGVIHIFRRDGQSWVNETRIFSPPLENDSGSLSKAPTLKFAFSGDGKTAVISFIGGKIFATANLAENFVFSKSEDGIWSQPVSLFVKDQMAELNKFKRNVAISSDGSTVAIEYLDAKNEICKNTQFGTSYIFVQKDGIWSQQSRIVGRDISLSKDGSKALFTVQEHGVEQRR